MSNQQCGQKKKEEEEEKKKEGKGVIIKFFIKNGVVVYGACLPFVTMGENCWREFFPQTFFSEGVPDK